MADHVAWLFCPADRPDRYAKAATHADIVILDLEDGVSPTDRPAARTALIAHPLDPDRTVVRVNPVSTPDHRLDLLALNDTPYQTVMLAKTESAEQASSLAPRRVVALCETPAGILHAPAIAEAEVVDALMWGAEDLIAGLGGQSSRHNDGRYRDIARHARSSVLLAAAAAGKKAIDAVYVNIADFDGLTAEASDAAASGFLAKACIHPTQVPTIQHAFRPTPELVAWAERILSTATTAPGVFALDGKMIDEPVLRHARTILDRR